MSFPLLPSSLMARCRNLSTSSNSFCTSQSSSASSTSLRSTAPLSELMRSLLTRKRSLQSGVEASLMYWNLRPTVYGRLFCSTLRWIRRNETFTRELSNRHQLNVGGVVGVEDAMPSCAAATAGKHPFTIADVPDEAKDLPFAAPARRERYHVLRHPFWRVPDQLTLMGHEKSTTQHSLGQNVRITSLRLCRWPN
ncbi:hypothetical protein BC567DRAFT_222788 [Phyllosticta citribraziliensis]